MKAADSACVVLASGLSQRFGEADKLEVELCGKPVLDYVLETVSSIGFGENFLVTQGLSRSGYTSTINYNPESGHGHALRLGLKAARAAGWDCICIVLGDMPLVEASYLRGMIKRLGEDQSVVSVLDGQKMPPALFCGMAISMILEDNSTTGARTLFHRLKPVTVAIDAEAALDIDTPADLARVEHIMKARKT